MRLAMTALLILTLAARAGVAQVGGNVGYGQAGGRARADQNERAKRQLTREEMPPTDTALFLDASVLMNVKADEFVATFGVAEEAETVEACQSKMDATIAAFTEALKPLGIGPSALFVRLGAGKEAGVAFVGECPEDVFLVATLGMNPYRFLEQTRLPSRRFDGKLPATGVGRNEELVAFAREEPSGLDAR